MAKLRGSKVLAIEIADVMKKIDRDNEGCSSFLNFAVGVTNFLHDKGVRLAHYPDLEELKYKERD